MALTRVKKAQKVEALAAELQGSTSAIVGTFTKLTVSQDFELRQKVRDAGGRYRVLKNKLASRASEGTGIGAALQNLKGVSSVAYTSGDPVALAKALSAWVKENAEFTFKLGIVDGKVITVQEVQALSTMPGKEELYAKLLFLISAPAQRLATVMAATGRDLAIVVNQAVEQNKFAAGSVMPEAVAAPEAVAPEAAPDAAAPDAAATPNSAGASAEAEVPEVVEAASETPLAVDAEPTSDATEAVASIPADGAAGSAEAESQTEAAASENPVEGQ